MVMSELKETAKKSRGNSPNGSLSSNHQSDEETNSRKNLGKNNGKSEFEEKIRVGKNYQVVVPEMVSTGLPENYNDKALLVWSPAKWIHESKLDEFIALAKESYNYNAEQALGMLFWHKHDLEKAVVDLANFTPYPDEFTSEEKALFAQAFQFHGKCFHRIRQMLPDKSIASLVKFYYSWKKTRRQEKKKKSENGSPNESETEEKIDSEEDDINGKNYGGNDINEIIGVSKNEENDDRTQSKDRKNSIMTPSGGKNLKRKAADNDEETSEKRQEMSINEKFTSVSVSVA